MQTACTGSNARQVAVLRLYHVQQCLASSTDALTTATVFVLNLDSALDHREMERDRVFFFFSSDSLCHFLSLSCAETQIQGGTPTC